MWSIRELGSAVTNYVGDVARGREKARDRDDFKLKRRGVVVPLRCVTLMNAERARHG